MGTKRGRVPRGKEPRGRKLRDRKPRGRDHRGGEPGGKVSARKKDKVPSTNAKAWSPPAGSWEDEIEAITGFDEEDGGKLMVYITWKNGEKTKHPTDVAHTKFPQKVRRPSLHTASANLTALDA